MEEKQERTAAGKTAVLDEAAAQEVEARTRLATLFAAAALHAQDEGISVEHVARAMASALISVLDAEEKDAAEFFAEVARRCRERGPAGRAVN